MTPTAAPQQAGGPLEPSQPREGEEFRPKAVSMAPAKRAPKRRKGSRSATEVKLSRSLSAGQLAAFASPSPGDNHTKQKQGKVGRRSRASHASGGGGGAPNTTPSKPKRRFVGISQYRQKKWEAHIWAKGGTLEGGEKGKQLHLGYFSTPMAAARAYDRAALFLRGKKAQINMPVAEYDQDPVMKALRSCERADFLALLKRLCTREEQTKAAKHPSASASASAAKSLGRSAAAVSPPLSPVQRSRGKRAVGGGCKPQRGQDQAQVVPQTSALTMHLKMEMDGHPFAHPSDPAAAAALLFATTPLSATGTGGHGHDKSHPHPPAHHLQSPGGFYHSAPAEATLGGSSERSSALHGDLYTAGGAMNRSHSFLSSISGGDFGGGAHQPASFCSGEMSQPMPLSPLSPHSLPPTSSSGYFSQSAAISHWEQGLWGVETHSHLHHQQQQQQRGYSSVRKVRSSGGRAPELSCQSHYGSSPLHSHSQHPCSSSYTSSGATATVAWKLHASPSHPSLHRQYSPRGQYTNHATMSQSTVSAPAATTAALHDVSKPAEDKDKSNRNKGSGGSAGSLSTGYGYEQETLSPRREATMATAETLFEPFVEPLIAAPTSLPIQIPGMQLPHDPAHPNASHPAAVASSAPPAAPGSIPLPGGGGGGGDVEGVGKSVLHGAAAAAAAAHCMGQGLGPLPLDQVSPYLHTGDFDDSCDSTFHVLAATEADPSVANIDPNIDDLAAIM